MSKPVQSVDRHGLWLNADYMWLAGAVAFGLVLGVGLPFAIRGALELYAAALCLIVLAGIVVMPREFGSKDDLAWRLFLVFVALYSLYPHYISLRLPGLPWISPIRLALAGALFAWILALRRSPTILGHLTAYIRENKAFFVLFATYLTAQVLSIPTALDPSRAASKFMLFQLYWTFPFFAVLSLARSESRLRLVVWIFVGFAAMQCIVGAIEARLERVVWLSLLPPGFRLDDDIIMQYLESWIRADAYRVKGSFSVSPIYAEFLVLMLPFAIYAFLYEKGFWRRSMGLLVALAILPALYASGSRLGIVGAITVILGFGTLFTLKVWRQHKRSMVGPLAMIVLPFVLIGFAAAYVSSPRLQTMTIGGGQHQDSSATRLLQIEMGIPRVAERPVFGHGVGQGAEALGYRNIAGNPVIDNYMLSMLLEIGFVGFAAFFGMIVLIAVQAGRRFILGDSDRAALLAPIALALVAFLVVKLVLSQWDTHGLVFIMMAMALFLFRLENEADLAAPKAAGLIQPAPTSGRGRAPWALPLPGVARGFVELYAHRPQFQRGHHPGSKRTAQVGSSIESGKVGVRN